MAPRLGNLLEFSVEEPGVLDFQERMGQSHTTNIHSVFSIDLCFSLDIHVNLKLVGNFLS